IEHQLLNHNGIKEPLVMARKTNTGENYLCAYLVPVEGEIDIERLRSDLSQTLPAYMIPAYFVPLERIPLTANGKVDKTALPHPRTGAGGTGRDYVAPRDEVEEKLAEIWQRVLESEPVGINEDFFFLGGDSIKALRLVSSINVELDSDLKLIDLYTSGTIESLSGRITTHKDIKRRQRTHAVIKEIESLKAGIIQTIPEPEILEDIFPMSDIEKGMVFSYMKNIGSGVYHDQFVYPMTYNNFDPERFEKALGLMVEKHGILRTGFNLEDFDEPVQMVHKKAILNFSYLDMAGLSTEEQETCIRTYLEEDLETPFQSDDSPLWRMKVFARDKDRILLIFIFHHAILDGWSTASLMSELHNTYLRLNVIPGYRVQTLGCSYKDAVIGERVDKIDPDSIDYWKSELADYKRTDFTETLKSETHVKGMTVYFNNGGEEIIRHLRELTGMYNTSLKHLCFAAYLVIMDMLTYENDLVVGIVAHNRPLHQDGDKILGCFLNTVPIRMQIPITGTWAAYINAIETKLQEVREHERLPLFEIARVIDEKNKDRNPIFDTLFNFTDFHIFKDTDIEEPLQSKPATGKEPDVPDKRFDLTGSQMTNTLFDFEVDITNGFLIIHPKYDPSAISDQVVQKSCTYFKRVLNKFIREPNSRISKNDILPPEEKQKLLVEFNDTTSPYSTDQTMHGLFQEQVERTPDYIALVGAELQIPNYKLQTNSKSQIPNSKPNYVTVTYRELNRQANRLAHALKQKGVAPGDLVAVIMNRSIPMVIAVMAILKAGGAYVPLEPYLPDTRIQKILDSLRVNVLLTDDNEYQRVERLGESLGALETILCPGGRDREEKASYPVENPSSEVSPVDFAYTIFTSGSTGTPKGVVETHRPVVNVIEWVNRTFNVGQPDKLLFVASLGFDLSVYDIFGILATGACLRVVEADDIKSPERLLEIILAEGVTFWDSAPAALQQLVPFLDEIADSGDSHAMRLVFLSGDWIPVTLPDALKEAFPGVQVISLGGATEATIWSNFHPIREVDPRWPSIPYGKPIQNAAYYILDPHLELCPIRVPGDLYIGGQCLASGYLNDPVLTAGKFIDNPFVPDEKLYKTGDMARWHAKGNMEFLGRKDHQVKVRGFRIELGEIESHLLAHNEIESGIAIARKDNRGDNFLCAYFTSFREMDKEELKAYLSRELPEYMIPLHFIQLESIPLTANGKVDRKALPAPETKTGSPLLLPEDDIQEKLAAIWSQVLVIEVGTIGIDSDFFELGGHSLNATMIISRIHKELEIKLPLTELFNSPTIRELAKYAGGMEEERYSPLEAVEVRDYYPLSSAQLRLFILQQLELDGTGYNMPEMHVMTEEPQREKFEETFRRLIDRHESLRTAFLVIRDQPVQKVHHTGAIEFGIRYFDKTVEGEWDSIIQDFVRPFDLTEAPLLRVGLAKIKDKTHMLMVDMHHIISDGVSHAILVNDFLSLYQGNPLSPVPVQYKDYALWQASEKERGTLIKQEKYWLRQYAEEIPVLNLPIDHSRPAAQSFEGDTIGFEIVASDTMALRALALEQESTIYMVLLSIYNVLLTKLSGQETIVVGTPVAGRGHLELQDVIGMFVNTLALVNEPGADKSFTGFLKEVRQQTLEAFENQDYPFEDLVDRVVESRDMSRNPLFDVMLVLQNMSVLHSKIPEVKAPAPKLMSYEFENKTSKFDLTFTGIETGDKLHFNVEYCTALFEEQTILRFIEYFKRIVMEVTGEPLILLAGIEIMSPGEKETILQLSNGPFEIMDDSETIHRMFEEQVNRTPDSIAVVGIEPGEEGREFRVQNMGLYIILTYRELNRQADALALRLRERGVGTDQVVALMVDRSVEMVIAILGIMKAGGAYLPIDSELPEERKTYFLADSGARIIVSNSFKLNGLEGLAVKKRDDANERPNQQTIKPINQPANHPSNLAYVIYTSGSTGKPKGVMVEHKNIVNLLKFQFKYSTIDCSCLLQFATISFDASIQEICSALLSGGRICLVMEAMRTDIPVLFRYIEINQIKTVFFPMSFLKVIFSEEDYIDRFPGCVTHIQTAGEQVVVSDRFRRYLQECNIHLHNHYGPSETHVITTLTLDPREDIPELPSIGRPIANTRIYILDKSKHLVPVGVAGQLCASGTQLGRGYLGKENLTTERFVENPFEPDAWLYLTGDLARWQAAGNIEFLGRIDHQVKIRGFRVELGEIESKLINHDWVKEAVVTIRTDDNRDKYLCGYIIPVQGDGLFDGARDPGSSLTTELRKHLSLSLPDYMIPSYFMSIEKIPVSATGKVDRRALPDPGTASAGVYAPPGDELERKLVEIWADVLGTKVETTGIDDNFFQSGGHSLRAIVLISRIHKQLDVKLSLVDIFNKSTIAGLADLVRKGGIGDYAAIEPVEEKDYYPLSSAQKRIFLLYNLEKESTAYNMPELLSRKGDIDAQRLQETIQRLIHRHESFRTSFEMSGGEMFQRVHPDVAFEIEWYGGEEEVIESEKLVASGSKPYASMINDFIRPFDLSQAPLLRVGLIKTGVQDYILMMDMHHIISDGVSRQLMIEDFLTLDQGKPLNPASLPLQYKDFAEWQVAMVEGGNSEGILARQKAYWLKRLEGEISVLTLPYDFVRPAVQSFAGSTFRFDIGEDNTRTLKTVAMEENATLYMVLFALFNVLLSKLSGQEDIIIGTPVAGRRHADLHHIIGMFVNTLPIRNYSHNDLTFGVLLQQVRQTAIDAFENQEYPFEEMVDQVSVPRDMGRNPLFDVLFAMQNIDAGKPTGREVRGTGLTDSTDFIATSYDYEATVSKFDLTLYAFESPRGLCFSFEYCTRLFKEETMKRFGLYYKMIVSAVVENHHVKVMDIDLVTNEEKQRLLYDFNNTRAHYPEDKTIHRLFEEQVECRPDHVAVVTDGSVTFRELNETSDRLAGLLREKGGGPDMIVGITVKPSVEMVTGLLGILKAGGAYFPISPDYPEERTRFMLADSGTRFWITGVGANQSRMSARVEGWSSSDQLSIVNVQLLVKPSASSVLKFEPASRVRHPADLAYVMYTSGSTGIPKGILVTHRNVVRLVKNTNFIRLEEDDRVMQAAPLEFDASTFEIWYPLLNGLGLYPVVRDIVLSASRMGTAIAKHRITTMWLTAPLFNQLLDTDAGIFALLGNLLVGGDVLSPVHINKVRNQYPHLNVINGYGPTENTTFSTTHLIDKEYHQSIPIGKPIANSRVYIVDRYGHFMPIGCAGELCVGGDGVSRGYMNNPELTVEKFERETFGYNASLYRTGDLARWLPDGNIEFLGRIDQQLKVSGYRIEPGEVESALLDHDGIKQAVVIGRSDEQGEKHLYAYIVIEGPEELNTLRVKHYLAAKLPGYMIPAYFVLLDKIPLKSSGKVDLEVLAAQGTLLGRGMEFVPPKTLTEKTIGNIWREVLNIDKVGVDEKFFDLGGNSLKIVQLGNRLKEALGQEIPVMKLFEYATIRSMAKYIDRQKSTQDKDFENIEINRAEVITQARKKRKKRAGKRRIAGGDDG
ncbi:MAG: amino acid adenylation domain-containing protein, partial [bacterium]|nr:amino acid adenylation domain-containing protein [bacterium]